MAPTVKVTGRGTVRDERMSRKRGLGVLCRGKVSSGMCSLRSGRYLPLVSSLFFLYFCVSLDCMGC